MSKSNHPVAVLPEEARTEIDEAYKQALLDYSKNPEGTILRLRRAYKEVWLKYIPEAQIYIQRRNRVLLQRGEI